MRSAGAVLMFLFGIGMILKILLIAWLVTVDHTRSAWTAMSWPVTDGVVVENAPVQPTHAARPVRRLRSLFHRQSVGLSVEFVHDGTARVATEIAGYGSAFSWRPSPADLAAAYPPGTAVRVRFDPADASAAYLEPGLVGWRALEMLAFIPLVAAIALGVHELIRSLRLRRDPLADAVVPMGTALVRVRMVGSTAWRWGTTVLLIATVVAIAGLLLAEGRQPALASVATVAAVIVVSGLLAAFMYAQWAASPRHELVLDRATGVITLPATARRADDDASVTRPASSIKEVPPDAASGAVRADLDDRLLPPDESAEHRTRDVRFDDVIDVELTPAEEGSPSVVRLRLRGPSAFGASGASSSSKVDLPRVAHGDLVLPAIATLILALCEERRQRQRS